LTERTQQRILVASDGTPFFFFCMEARVLVLKRKPDEDVVIVTPSGESIVVSVLGVRSMSTVDHPSHYNAGKIEVIEAIDDWQLGFYEGNVVKYVARAKHKGSELEDLKKAAWYLNRLIENKGKATDA
jgi:hypothetical protein